MRKEGRYIPNSDVSQFGWRMLRRFHDEAMVAERIIERFGVSQRYIQDVRKQARQIRYCLMQAHEYSMLARQASLATKPLQLYYSTMSMALAEVLWKGDGRVSLDKLRETHSHHGLNLRFEGRKEILPELVRATPLLIPGKGRTGTFSVWHEHASETGMVGKLVANRESGGTVGLEVIFQPVGVPLADVPEQGYSLIDVFSSVPAMQAELEYKRYPEGLVRFTLTHFVDDMLEPKRNEVRIVTHPANEIALGGFMDQFKLAPAQIPDVDIMERHQGIQIVLRSQGPHSDGGGQMCNGISTTDELSFAAPFMNSLNEFGMYYYGLYILGMLCRYYPDLWMREIERNSTFIQLSEIFIDSAFERVPLYLAGEFDECVYVGRGLH